MNGSIDTLSKDNTEKPDLTFNGKLLAFPLLLVSAEAADVSDADDVVVDVEPERVELEELDPELGHAAAVPNLDAGQVDGGTCTRENSDNDFYWIVNQEPNLSKILH